VHAEILVTVQILAFDALTARGNIKMTFLFIIMGGTFSTYEDPQCK